VCDNILIQPFFSEDLRMPGPFEGATRAAIEELIQNHAQESKFGLILTRDSFQDLVGDLYALLVTSRSLKAAGDRLLSGGPVALGNRTTLPRTKR
jgi:putative AlgH/UPF0301 family transcriptional regulator